jgi:RNA polymerase sigma-70 factor (ECF subfamily)
MANDEKAMSSQTLSTSSARVELERLYEQEVARVHGFLLARCGSRTLAEDLTAEVFINAAQRFAQGRQMEVTTAWLISVAKRRLVDHWRTSERQGRRLDKLRLERSADQALDMEDDRVLAALESLSTRQRAALTLRYLDEHSVSEVADALGTTYQATESLLARARSSFERAYGANS